MKIILLTIALAVAIPATASATDETIGQMLSRICPDGYRLERQEMRALSLVEPDQEALAKEAADAYYDCYSRATDSYYRDWLQASYLGDLFETFDPTDQQQALNIVTSVISQLEDLRDATQYADVRKYVQGQLSNAYDTRDHLEQGPE